MSGINREADCSDKNFVTVDDLKDYVLDLTRWGLENDSLQKPKARTEGLGSIILADYRKIDPRLSNHGVDCKQLQAVTSCNLDRLIKN